MPKSDHRIKTKKPVNALKKPLRADFKDLFKALAKGIGHIATGKWAELGADTVETLAAIGLATEPGELSFLLVQRSLTMAIFQLVGEGASHLLCEVEKDASNLLDSMDFSAVGQGIQIDRKFFDRPGELPPLREIQPILQQWLVWHGWGSAASEAIVERLPGYFVYSLSQEWRKNLKSYRPLAKLLKRPLPKPEIVKARGWPMPRCCNSASTNPCLMNRSA